jgi:hypothetical protein
MERPKINSANRVNDARTQDQRQPMFYGTDLFDSQRLSFLIQLRLGKIVVGDAAVRIEILAPDLPGRSVDDQTLSACGTNLVTANSRRLGRRRSNGKHGGDADTNAYQNTPEVYFAFHSEKLRQLTEPSNPAVPTFDLALSNSALLKAVNSFS